jgi:hypothetical protein
MKTFEVGQRVVLVAGSNLEEWNEYEDDTTRGAVQSIEENGSFIVKWDAAWRKPNPNRHTTNELITEIEADKILSKLEKEFEAWAGPIRKKMEQAAKYLLEAGELASKQKKDLAELHEIVGPLISAMNDIGWSTSSLSC